MAKRKHKCNLPTSSTVPRWACECGRIYKPVAHEDGVTEWEER